MNPNYILTIMILAYIIPIAYVYYIYKTSGANSISSVITSNNTIFPINSEVTITYPILNMVSNLFQTRNIIAGCMFIMAVFTILYEYQRCEMYMNSHMWSLFAIIILLIGIFGVIYIPETNSLHYVFGAAAFFAIIGFMAGHTYHHYRYHGQHGGNSIGTNLRIILYIQILFMAMTIIYILQGASIFAVEALFLANFAVFYLYIHFHNLSNSVSHSSR